LWDAPADIQFAFAAGQLQRIEATFKQPPAFAVAVADYEKQFGPPKTKQIASQEQTSTVTWQAKSLNVTLTETQGTMKALYETVQQK
jgi:hypothetical protein